MKACSIRALVPCGGADGDQPRRPIGGVTAVLGALGHVESVARSQPTPAARPYAEYQFPCQNVARHIAPQPFEWWPARTREDLLVEDLHADVIASRQDDRVVAFTVGDQGHSVPREDRARLVRWFGPEEAGEIRSQAGEDLLERDQGGRRLVSLDRGNHPGSHARLSGELS